MFGLSTLGPLNTGFSFPAPQISQPTVFNKEAIPSTQGKNNMGVNAGGAATGAASGAVAGTTVMPGWGTLIGGVIGGIAGLFTPKSSQAAPATGTTAGLASPSTGASGMPSLLGALGSGLSSIPFLPSSNTQTNTQMQSVTQSNSMNVQNVLGGSAFGGVDPATGNFDIFKTISDVFQIRDAQAAQVTSGGGVVSAAGVTTNEGAPNYIPMILLAAGGVGLLYIFTKKGK